ncbi:MULTISPECIES: phosphoglycolate phosphatase [Salinivibrio]|uniref:phosphoglycolate phosphatase n=1 Tax=Salinivibrio TaxID=51366 RepID=UPI0009879090|nr:MULTISPECIES: phosphoglycolate phosphatase [Salinivibrio]OOF29009.1 phosphoglycolate phosphatase [Salinivibrio sp. IB872]OOF32283.1 phosphoglycolate phosphatase [Salinivibrio proteolyticus]
MTTPATVLFDLDGTLLDTAPDMGMAANRVLAEYNLPPLSQEQIYRHTSHGARGLLTAGFGDKAKEQDPIALRARFLHHYGQAICSGTTLYEGIEALLDLLEHQAIPWGIVTNKPEGLTHQLLTFFPRLQQAQVIVGADTYAHAKPHPLPLLEAAKTLNCAPEHCFYVGDIENDMLAARAANMGAAVAAWGYTGGDDVISKWEADHIFATPHHLSAFIGS